MLSPRPPTGLILNPLMSNALRVKFDHAGTPVQRSIIGKIDMFQKVQVKRDIEFERLQKRNSKGLKQKRGSRYTNIGGSSRHDTIRHRVEGEKSGERSTSRTNRPTPVLATRNQNVSRNHHSPARHLSSGLMVKDLIESPGFKTGPHRHSPGRL